ncbi:ubiquitin-related domain-containing protein [Roridomyces roridus]|uniref:Ubiquitin-related domain-containing protein n=1 Tax=Roridomyces roridus TaxID=1738132 RepID=A0AAD7BKN7_9AGAR|nr:ubiquitin-related domain-containing protein [Roridomyces roridus]
MANDQDALLAMGFDAARVQWALKATGNRGLQPAMDHILENEGKPVPELGAVSESAPSQRDAMDVDDDEDAEALKSLGLKANDVEAKSIKCSECGKVFRNTAVAQFHAEKSGHQEFEESTEELKPLTEEEKKAKLAELREKMAEKRERKAVEYAKEAKASEIIRRKAGKDMGSIKEEMEKRQALKDAEEKKKEKIEDAKARAAIKAQIEADKKARAEKFAREKALRHGEEIVDAPAAPTAAAASSSAPSGVAGKDFKETRLQIRMSTGGQPYTTTLSSEAPLREVAEFLAGQSLQVDVETVSFAQHFPRKQFTKSDFPKSLRELGLTPSAVLIATPQ